MKYFTNKNPCTRYNSQRKKRARFEAAAIKRGGGGAAAPESDDFYSPNCSGGGSWEKLFGALMYLIGLCARFTVIEYVFTMPRVKCLLCSRASLVDWECREGFFTTINSLVYHHRRPP